MHLVAGDAVQARQEDVAQQSIELVDRERERVRRYLRVRLLRVDLGIREDVRREQMVERADRLARGQPGTGWERSDEKGLQRTDVDLVQRHPPIDERAELMDRSGHPLGEALRGIEPQPELVSQPTRMGEVVQRDQRVESALTACAEDVAIPTERRVVPVARRRLAPGPLDREPEAVAPRSHGSIEVVGVTLPEIECDAGPLDAACPLPAVPVVPWLARAVVVTLDLEPGGRHPEPEPVGE